jgi:hypothetical protein
VDRPKLLFDEGKLYRPEWRETVLLLGGILCSQGPERIDAFLAKILDGLSNDAPLADRTHSASVLHEHRHVVTFIDMAKSQA